MEGGDFYREIQSGQRSARRLVAFARVRPLGNLLAEQIHEVQITLRVLLRLGLANDRFAKDIRGKGNVPLVQLAQSGDDFFLVVAEHELARHAGDLRLYARAEEPGHSARGL